MKKSLLAILAALLILSMVACVAACGSDEEPASSDTTAAPGNTDTTAAGDATETTAAAATDSTAPSGDRKVLRLACPWPQDDTPEIPLRWFADAFNEAQSEYVIELHPGGALYAMADEFDAVTTGGVELVGFPVAVFGSIVPEFNIAELPFAINSIEADCEFNKAMRDFYNEFLPEKYNMRAVLGFTLQGVDIVSASKPVKTLDDWKGELTQSISPVTAQVITLLGGSAVAIDFSEGYQAMQKKVIAATLQSAGVVKNFKLGEVGKYVTRSYLVPAGGGLFVNEDVYQGFSDEIKQIWEKTALEVQDRANEMVKQGYYDSVQLMKDNGMELYVLPTAERDKWAEKVAAYSQELMDALDPASAEKINTIIKDLDAKYPYKAE